MFAQYKMINTEVKLNVLFTELMQWLCNIERNTPENGDVRNEKEADGYFRVLLRWCIVKS